MVATLKSPTWQRDTVLAQIQSPRQHKQSHHSRHRYSKSSSSSSSLGSMAERKMRIAIAGTNGLALMIAMLITRHTSHQIIVLSRFEQPQLSNEPYQVLVVDYDSQSSLQHAVMGVHTIISTVTGVPQLELIKAAVAQRVRRFAPAEFEGTPSARLADDSLDRGKKTARDWLEHYRGQMQSTVFTCGVLYERFAPNGLHGLRIGLGMDYGHEGDYLVNVRSLLSYAPFYDAGGNSVKICMTAAQDVAMMVVRAIDMKTWPKEQTIVGEKMTVAELLQAVVKARGKSALHPQSTTPTPIHLAQDLQDAVSSGDEARQVRVRELIATVNRRYVFSRPDRNYSPIRFEDWLTHHWSQHAVTNA